MDSDDYIDLDMYGYLINLLENNDADISECGYRNIYPGEKMNNFDYLEKQECIVVDREEALERLVTTNLFHTVVWNKIYKREVLEGIQFEKNKWFEDLFFTHKVFYKCKRLVASNQKKYNYLRKREGSITQNSFSYKNLDYIEGVNERIKFFTNINHHHGLKETQKLKLSKLLEFVYLNKSSIAEDKKISALLDKELRDLDSDFDYRDIKYNLILKKNLYKINSNLYYIVMKLFRSLGQELKK